MGRPPCCRDVPREGFPLPDVPVVQLPELTRMPSWRSRARAPAGGGAAVAGTSLCTEQGAQAPQHLGSGALWSHLVFPGGEGAGGVTR